MKRKAEFRAEAVKSLAEQRAVAVADIQSIIAGAKDEKRAISDEENEKLIGLEKTIDSIDKTLDAERRAAKLFVRAEEERAEDDGGADNIPDEQAKAEERAFLGYVSQQTGMPVPAEYRSGEQNITMGNNGAVIPTSIASRIINTVKEMCPIFSKATMFAVKGTLKVPVWGNANTTHNISVGFQNEFTELTADAGKFTSVDLTGYLAGALTLIGKSVITNSEINVLDFIVAEMSKKIALFLESCGLAASTTVDATAGTTVSGALSTTTTLNAESTSAIAADRLIELQAQIPTAYQGASCWIMHPDTFTSIRKLKDGAGQYLLQTTNGIVGGFPYQILGKPVYLSDNMPTIASGTRPVLYGDCSGLAFNMRQNIDMQVLNEKYATQHAIGLVSWFEFDCKVIDNQKLAALVMSVTA